MKSDLISNPMKATEFADVLRAARARRGILVMGICNVTPDSFSDGGQAFNEAAACTRIEQMIAEGAGIIDIGAESTQPGLRPVAPAIQIDRALEIVRWASARVCVSIDTTSAEVASACLDAGAHVVNDVSLLADEGVASVCAKANAALVLSHARVPQSKMADFGAYDENAYDDVVVNVLAEWERAAERAQRAGVARSALVMDPGLGFSKSNVHSLELLRRTSEIVSALDVPVLIGASRKSLLTLAAPDTLPVDRLGASIAVAIHAARSGASIVRVHDVGATVQAIDTMRALHTRHPARA